MTVYKIGDKVRCIAESKDAIVAASQRSFAPKVGIVYTVTAVRNGFLKLNGKWGEWDAGRFEPANQD